MSQVRQGDTVQIHFTGKLETGAVFGTSEGQDPVRFVVGGGQMLGAIDNAVLGMEAGQEKSVTVTPEEGFGERRPELQQRVPRSALPGEVKVGERLLAHQGEEQMPVWVRELGDDFAVVDGNHPLAGQTMIFDIELVAIDSTE